MLHKPARRRFTQNHTYVAEINAGRPGQYAGYHQAKRRNNLFSHRDWCIFQGRLVGAGPLQIRQGNHGGFRAGAHNREPTPL